MDLYVRFKMVHVVIELVWDTIEDEAEQTKPEDSDEELLRGPWFSELLRGPCFSRSKGGNIA